LISLRSSLAAAALFALLALHLERDAVMALLQGAPLRFRDPDDALRLVQVRGLLAGGPWFDPVIGSVGEAPGMVSHWSRLIDLPIALLIRGVAWIADLDTAELVAMIAWPKLVLVGFLTLMIRETRQEAGWAAALAMLALYWLSIHGLGQFQLFRIDHHNVQNACAVLALVLVTSPSANGRSALAAGLIAGLGLAVGYEALPFIALAAGMLALVAAFDPGRRAVAEGFAAGLAVSLILLFVLTVSPQRWFTAPCDALGLNAVLGAALGCCVVIASSGASGWRSRAFLLVLGGAAAAIVAWRLEPACIAGPFAKVDPAIQDLWLSHVMEAQSLLQLGETQPATALATGLSLMACLLLQAWAAFRPRSAGETLRLVLLAALTIAAFRYLKMIPYAQLFGFYCAALAACRLPGVGASLSPRVSLLLALLLVSPAAPAALIGAVSPAAAAKAEASRQPNVGGGHCWREENLHGLAALPPARILAQPDMGAVVALMLHHRSLVAQYHRLDRETLRAAAVFQAPAGEARRGLSDWNVDIIAHCLGHRFYEADNPPGSLADMLDRDAPPPYLDRIELGNDNPVRAYRVRRLDAPSR
jgi:hypothetical protein